jgi:ribosomal protein S18 acetylase RimI-like enzyme
MMPSVCSLATPAIRGNDLAVREMFHPQAASEIVVFVLEPGDTALLSQLVNLMCRQRSEHVEFEAPSNHFDPAEWLRQNRSVAVAALHQGALIGGLVASQIHRLGYERGELYVSQLAVSAKPSRPEVATRLLRTLEEEARRRGLGRILIQADLIDFPAIAQLLPPVPRKDSMQFELRVAQ